MEYLSQERFDELVAELRQLVSELPKAKNEISEARDKGDLSENFEYHAAKRAQGKLLGRIRFLQRILENSQVLDPSKRETDKVMLLSKVTIENLKTHAAMTYTLVNPHEVNMAEKKISVKSPIGQALLNHKVGDIVEAQVPAGLLQLKITAIDA